MDHTKAGHQLQPTNEGATTYTTEHATSVDYSPTSSLTGEFSQFGIAHEGLVPGAMSDAQWDSASHWQGEPAAIGSSGSIGTSAAAATEGNSVPCPHAIDEKGQKKNCFGKRYKEGANLK